MPSLAGGGIDKILQGISLPSRLRIAESLITVFMKVVTAMKAVRFPMEN